MAILVAFLHESKRNSKKYPIKGVKGNERESKKGHPSFVSYHNQTLAKILKGFLGNWMNGKKNLIK